PPNARRGPVVTKDDIKRGLRELGLLRGDVVGVHSSLRSFGHVEGGADAVIDALLETVGEEGAVVMPTHSTNLEKVERTPEEIALGMSWKFRILPFDPQETPCTTGVIPETFRKRTGAVRSVHPSLSLTAMGKNAGALCQGWDKVLEADGYVLLIGVGLDRCTAMHLAERRVRFPERILKMITPPKEIVERYPSDEWEWDFGRYPDFAKLEPLCRERGIMRTTVVGAATLRLLKLKDLVALYAEALVANPDLFYGGRETGAGTAPDERNGAGV
ncbi:MAG: AAC(3) family N-acetyltransferase, partial [Candidatus Bipolaricaulota bacterium]